jgi:hypothetical protein
VLPLFLFLRRTLVSQIFVELNTASTMSVNSSIQSFTSDEPKLCDPFWACCLHDYEDYREVNTKKSRLSTLRKVQKDRRDRRDAKKRREEQLKRAKRKAKEDAAMDAQFQAKYQSLLLF